MSDLLKRRLAMAAVVGFSLTPAAYGASTLYTLDADFDTGVLDSVNHDAPNNNQLQLNEVGTTFPVLWIANAGERTVSKIDTDTNKEVARYRTGFGATTFANLTAFGAHEAPSRTAVDIDGNVYVINRQFAANRSPSILKILSEGFIDRNGNGIADTSSDADNSGTISATETKDLVDTNGNGVIDIAEIQDERVAWVMTFPASGPNSEANGIGRALCIGTDGNLWAGMFSTRRYYKVDSTTGAIISGPHPVPASAYGCLVDGSGILWSATIGNGDVVAPAELVRLDTNNPSDATKFIDTASLDYGIALGNGKIYLGTIGGNQGFREFTPGPNTFNTPGGSKGVQSVGISVDTNGNIWFGRFSGGGVFKSTPAGAIACTGATQSNTETRGVIVDADNNIWQINRFTNSVSKYRGSDCAPLGVFPVGFDPYTYSDATGITARNTTTPTGTWTVINDGGSAGKKWNLIAWTEQTPTGGSVQVRARVADNQADLPNQTFQLVSNGADPMLMGRFIQIQTRLTANTAEESPILFDLTVSNVDATARTCDVDADGDIDKLDTAAISRARNQTVQPGDVRDANGDGRITLTDVKACIKLCTRTSCATQ